MIIIGFKRKLEMIENKNGLIVLLFMFSVTICCCCYWAAWQGGWTAMFGMLAMVLWIAIAKFLQKVIGES
jgi:CHASE2 domain-containing sensor protein